MTAFKGVRTSWLTVLKNRALSKLVVCKSRDKFPSAWFSDHVGTLELLLPKG
jgi:hypothetical protein